MYICTSTHANITGIALHVGTSSKGNSDNILFFLIRELWACRDFHVTRTNEWDVASVSKAESCSCTVAKALKFIGPWKVKRSTDELMLQIKRLASHTLWC